VVGGGGVAHAAPQTLIDCDQVGGTGKITPVISNVQTPNTAASIATPVGFNRVCTGSLAAAAGPLTAVKGKLVGDASCNTSAPPSTKPLAGKVTMTYTNLDATLHVLSSATFIRSNFAGAPQPADALTTTGIVTKGVGVAGDVKGLILFHPTNIKDANVIAAGNSTINLGQVNPGLGSLELGVNCQLAPVVIYPGIPATFASIVWATDGDSLSTVASPPVAGHLNSSLGITLP